MPGLIVAALVGMGIGGSCMGITGASSQFFGIGLVGFLLSACLIAGYFIEKPKYWVRIGTAGASWKP